MGAHLAIFLVDGGFALASVYVRQFVTRELEFAETAVVFNLKALVSYRAPRRGGGVRQGRFEMPDATTARRIVLDPEVMLGKPIVRGTRITVEHVVGLMAEGWTETQLLENHPQLTRADIQACLAYARDLVASERVFPSAA